MTFLIQIALNVAILPLIAYLLPGLDFTGTWWQLLLAGTALGVINFPLKHFLKAIFPSFFFVVLAVLTIFLNISLLVFISLVVPGVAIAGILPALWALFIVSLANYSAATLLHYQEK